MKKFLTLILLVGVSAFIQGYGLSLLGIRPNLALAAVSASAFFAADFFEGIFLVLLAALILKSGPGFESGILAFSAIGAALAGLVKFIPWRYFFGNLTATVLAVLAFYAVLNPGLILSMVFLKELFLDTVFSALIFAFLRLLWQDK